VSTRRSTSSPGAAPFSSLFPGEPPAARTPLLSDVVCSSIPWHAAVRDALLHGRLPLWNPYLLGGEPLLAVQQAAAASTRRRGSACCSRSPRRGRFRSACACSSRSRRRICSRASSTARRFPALVGAFALGVLGLRRLLARLLRHELVAPFPLLALALRRIARDAGPAAPRA
jgi:hypothetical protein